MSLPLKTAMACFSCRPSTSPAAPRPSNRTRHDECDDAIEVTGRAEVVLLPLARSLPRSLARPGSWEHIMNEGGNITALGGADAGGAAEQIIAIDRSTRRLRVFAAGKKYRHCPERPAWLPPSLLPFLSSVGKHNPGKWGDSARKGSIILG